MSESPTFLPPQERDKRALLARVEKIMPIASDKDKTLHQIVDESLQLFGRPTKSDTQLHINACYIASLIAHGYKQDAAYNLVTQDISAANKLYDKEGRFVGLHASRNSRKVLRSKRAGHGSEVDKSRKKALPGSRDVPHGERKNIEPTLEELGVQLEGLQARLAEIDKKIEVAKEIESRVVKIGNSFQAVAAEQEKVKGRLQRYVSVFLEQVARATGSDHSQAFASFEKDFADIALTYDERYDPALQAHFAVYDKLFLTEPDLVARIVENVSSQDLFILDGVVDQIVTNPKKGSEGEINRLLLAWHKNFVSTLRQNREEKYSVIYLHTVEALRRQLIKVSPIALDR